MKARKANLATDLVTIVDAAYEMDAPAREWGERLLRATEQTVGGGIGGFACKFRWKAQSGLCFERDTLASLGVPEPILATILNGLATTPPQWFQKRLMRKQGSAFCVLTSEADGKTELEYRAALEARGIPDGINVVGLDLDRSGFLVSLGVPPSYRLPAALRAGLRRAGTHILAALRIRSRLATARSPDQPFTTDSRTANAMPPPEAILEPSGKLLHAEGKAAVGAARLALQAATQRIEQLRAFVDDDDEALASWKGLVASRWTLLNSFERDGKRYVLARENLPEGRGVPALTETERVVVTYAASGCSTKETAYALGISDSTVRVLLMRAARRYGARDRGHLFKLWRREQPSSRDQ